MPFFGGGVKEGVSVEGEFEQEAEGVVYDSWCEGTGDQELFVPRGDLGFSFIGYDLGRSSRFRFGCGFLEGLGLLPNACTLLSLIRNIKAKNELDSPLVPLEGKYPATYSRL